MNIYVGHLEFALNMMLRIQQTETKILDHIATLHKNLFQSTVIGKWSGTPIAQGQSGWVWVIRQGETTRQKTDRIWFPSPIVWQLGVFGKHSIMKIETYFETAGLPGL